MQDQREDQNSKYMEDSLENISENKHEDHHEYEKQIPLSERVFTIVDELVSNRIKSIAEKYENQQQSIDKYQETLNQLLSTAEKVLSDLEKANEQKQTAAAAKASQIATPQIGSTKKSGQGSMITSLMGMSSALPVITEAVPISQRLTTSVNQLPAPANLSKISKGATLEARSQRGSKLTTKENADEESSSKAKTVAERKESNKEQLHAIDEGTPQAATHRITASTHNNDAAKTPKIQELKNSRNLAKNKSMIQLKQEETTKPEVKSRFGDNKETTSKVQERKGTVIKKDDTKQKQEEEEKPKIEKKPAVPKAGASNDKTGSDGKAKDKHLKNSASVSQFNTASETKTTKTDKSSHTTVTKGKSTATGAKKEDPNQALGLDSSHAKIIPRKHKEEKPDTPKVEEQKEEKKPSQQELEKKTEIEQVVQTNNIEFTQNQEQEKLIIVSEKDIAKQEEDENLLDDIEHGEQAEQTELNNNKETAQSIPENEQPQVKEFDVNILQKLIKDFFDGKETAETLNNFCIQNSIYNEQIDETLIFTQIDLQKIVDDFNTNHPDSGDFSETFQLQSSTKEGLQLIEINFMSEMMEKEEFDESVLNMFELLYVILDGPEIELYRKVENKENYIREYMNENYDKFVGIVLSLEGKVQELNKNYEVKKFMKEYVEQCPFITDQDYYFAIEPLCALLSPVIEEIIIFMGIKETNTNKKNVNYFKYQLNQVQTKRINELNQIIVNNTYNQNNEE